MASWTEELPPATFTEVVVEEAEEAARSALGWLAPRWQIVQEDPTCDCPGVIRAVAWTHWGARRKARRLRLRVARRAAEDMGGLKP